MLDLQLQNTVDNTPITIPSKKAVTFSSGASKLYALDHNSNDIQLKATNESSRED